MTNTEVTPRIYVGTYAKYNNGSIEGAWLDLTDYADAEDFLNACKELHKDEEDPELMFQDFEGFPDFLYSESMGESEIQKIIDSIEILEKIENFDTADWVNLHNQYCQENGYGDNEIFSFDDDFFNTYFEGKPMEAARAASFGEINWSDDYIKFNGYGNLESINEYSVERHIDKDEIMKDVLENPENYSI